MRPNAESSDNPIDPFTARLIAHKARQLARGPGYSRADQEDLQQALTLKLLRSVGYFDPGRGAWRGFVLAVVKEHAAKLARDAMAQKRHPGRVRSLHDRVRTHDGLAAELGASIDDRSHSKRLGTTVRSQRERDELLIDVADLLAELSAEDQELCRRLLRGISVSQVAQDMGLPRSTVQSKLRRLRVPFERRGLRNYFQKRSPVHDRIG